MSLLRDAKAGDYIRFHDSDWLLVTDVPPFSDDPKYASAGVGVGLVSAFDPSNPMVLFFPQSTFIEIAGAAPEGRLVTL